MLEQPSPRGGARQALGRRNIALAEKRAKPPDTARRPARDPRYFGIFWSFRTKSTAVGSPRFASAHNFRIHSVPFSTSASTPSPLLYARATHSIPRASPRSAARWYHLNAAAKSFDANFDLDAVSKAIKDHLDDYEAKGHRGETFKFTEKKFQINRNDLAVVVFVQDEKTKHVLQAAIVDLSTPSSTRSTTEAQ